MANIFNSVKVRLQKKNKFNLSYASRLTTEFGRLTPILCEETLPNDTFRIKSILRCQFAPMKFPVMQRFTAYMHYFFVARRLLMDDWETFITGGEDGVTEIHYPTVPLTDGVIQSLGTTFDPYEVPAGEINKSNLLKSGSLFDYLGFPAFDGDYNEILSYSGATPDQQAACHQIDALPFKAYQLIYNEWYRDENLTDPVELFTDVNGMQTLDPDITVATCAEWFKLRNRAWKKDYFTSALPDPQRGPDVTLPLVSGAISAKDASELDRYLDLDVKIDNGYATGDDPRYYNNIKAGQTFSGSLTTVALSNDNDSYQIGDDLTLHGSVDAKRNELAQQIAPELQVDGDTSRSATINEVRRAFAIQRWYELAARAGNRYIESILGHFGIRSSDARLQRPEYIGGSVVAVNVGDVLQTSESGETPLGTPAGIAQALGTSKRIKYTCEEHGYIIGILSIIPEASYPQGMPRKFMRRDKFDFAWPLLANLGEQEIKKGELYYNFTREPELNDDGFGYAPRYAEYKFGLGQVHGDFRTSLRDFHDARFFDSAPRLNDEFIEVSTANDGDDGLNRIFAVRSSQMADHLWVSMYNDVVVRRVLPKYGTPI